MQTGDREVLSQAKWIDDKDGFEAQLVLEKVALTDKFEYSVFTQRLKPNSNYAKTFIWTEDLDEAQRVFQDVMHKNPEYKLS